MSDIKFSCPSCQQHIQADAGYGGMQINCPACAAPLIVPGGPAVAPPPAAPETYAPVYTPQPSASAATVHAPAAPAAAAAGSRCPSCGNPLPRGAIICTKCGYNQATKKRIVAGREVGMGAAMAPSGETPWYKTAYPYIGLLVLVLGALYYGGKTNPMLKLIFLGVLALYCLLVHILVTISAFSEEGAGTGFLTLCVPFYAAYYVFKVSDNTTLQALYATAFIINIALRFIRLQD